MKKLLVFLSPQLQVLMPVAVFALLVTAGISNDLLKGQRKGRHHQPFQLHRLQKETWNTFSPGTDESCVHF